MLKIIILSMLALSTVGYTSRIQTRHQTFRSSDLKTYVDDIVNSNKVVVFSKDACPHCKEAVEILKKYTNNIKVEDISEKDNMVEIQDNLEKKTRARTVPRIFINGNCIGGADDVRNMHQSKSLKELIS
eukprot:GHVL01007020.1.p1 GENE.GHVL01007020.1~~GHVL01007020.1.p1  ORF type:complete len:129 (+),score=23.17 GHVL01007020.1:9-395(+)